jgi:hypothetical protein
MYCPNCGKSNNNNQKYCSGCGLSLRASEEVLARELAAAPSEQLTARKTESDQKGLVESRRGFLQHPLVYGFLLMIIGTFVAVLGKKIPDKTVSDIGTLTVLLGMGLVGLHGVMTVLASNRPQNTVLSLKREATDELPAPSLSVPVSVTENTTRQLDAGAEVGSLNVPAQRAGDTQRTLSR